MSIIVCNKYMAKIIRARNVQTVFDSKPKPWLLLALQYWFFCLGSWTLSFRS